MFSVKQHFTSLQPFHNHLNAQDTYLSRADTPVSYKLKYQNRCAQFSELGLRV